MSITELSVRKKLIACGIVMTSTVLGLLWYLSLGEYVQITSPNVNMTCDDSLCRYEVSFIALKDVNISSSSKWTENKINATIELRNVELNKSETLILKSKSFSLIKGNNYTWAFYIKGKKPTETIELKIFDRCPFVVGKNEMKNNIIRYMSNDNYSYVKIDDVSINNVIYIKGKIGTYINSTNNINRKIAFFSDGINTARFRYAPLYYEKCGTWKDIELKESEKRHNMTIPSSGRGKSFCFEIEMVASAIKNDVNISFGINTVHLSVTKISGGINITTNSSISGMSGSGISEYQMLNTTADVNSLFSYKFDQNGTNWNYNYGSDPYNTFMSIDSLTDADDITYLPDLTGACDSVEKKFNNHVMNVTCIRGTTSTSQLIFFGYPFNIQSVITGNGFQLGTLAGNGASPVYVNSDCRNSTIGTTGTFHCNMSNRFAMLIHKKTNTAMFEAIDTCTTGQSKCDVYAGGSAGYEYDNWGRGQTLTPNITHNFYYGFIALDVLGEENALLNKTYDEFFFHASSSFTTNASHKQIFSGKKIVYVNDTDYDGLVNISVIPNTLNNGTYFYINFPKVNMTDVYVNFSGENCTWGWNGNKYIPNTSCSFNNLIDIKRGDLDCFSSNCKMEENVTHFALMNYKFTNNNSKELKVSKNKFDFPVTPSVTIVSPQNITYKTRSILVNLTSVGSYTWFWNGSNNISYSSEINYTFQEGINTLNAYSNNSVGAIASSKVTFTVCLNPTIKINGSSAEQWFEQGSLINISFSGTTGCYYCLSIADLDDYQNMTCGTTSNSTLIHSLNQRSNFTTGKNISISLGGGIGYIPIDRYGEAGVIQINISGEIISTIFDSFSSYPYNYRASYFNDTDKKIFDTQGLYTGSPICNVSIPKSFTMTNSSFFVYLRTWDYLNSYYANNFTDETEKEVDVIYSNYTYGSPIVFTFENQTMYFNYTAPKNIKDANFSFKVSNPTKCWNFGSAKNTESNLSVFNYSINDWSFLYIISLTSLGQNLTKSFYIGNDSISNGIISIRIYSEHPCTKATIDSNPEPYYPNYLKMNDSDYSTCYGHDGQRTAFMKFCEGHMDYFYPNFSDGNTRIYNISLDVCDDGTWDKNISVNMTSNDYNSLLTGEYMIGSGNITNCVSSRCPSTDPCDVPFRFDTDFPGTLFFDLENSPTGGITGTSSTSNARDIFIAVMENETGSYVQRYNDIFLFGKIIGNKGYQDTFSSGLYEENISIPNTGGGELRYLNISSNGNYTLANVTITGFTNNFISTIPYQWHNNFRADKYYGFDGNMSTYTSEWTACYSGEATLYNQNFANFSIKGSVNSNITVTSKYSVSSIGASNWINVTIWAWNFSKSDWSLIQERKDTGAHVNITTFILFKDDFVANEKIVLYLLFHTYHNGYGGSGEECEMKKYFDSNISFSAVDIPDMLVDVGGDGVYEANATNVSTLVVNLNATLLNQLIGECTSGFCEVPVYFFSTFGGNFSLTSLMLNYTFNPITLPVSEFNTYLKENQWYFNLYNLTSTNLGISFFSLYGGTAEVKIHNASMKGSTNMTIISNHGNNLTWHNEWSNWTSKLPYTFMNKIRFYMNNLSVVNATPWYQTSTRPIINLTNKAGGNITFGIKQNETLPSCLNLSFDTGYPCSNHNYRINSSFTTLKTNVSSQSSIPVCLFIDAYNCSSRQYDFNIYFDSFCERCAYPW